MMICPALFGPDSRLVPKDWRWGTSLASRRIRLPPATHTISKPQFSWVGQKSPDAPLPGGALGEAGGWDPAR